MRSEKAGASAAEATYYKEILLHAGTTIDASGSCYELVILYLHIKPSWGSDPSANSNRGATTDLSLRQSESESGNSEESEKLSEHIEGR